MNDTTSTDRLARLIALKRDLLLALRALAERQLEIIAADNIERLLSLLAEKQPLLNTLQQVEQALDPFRHEDANSRVWRSADDRRRCQTIADEANTLLAELLQLEKQAESSVAVSRDQTANELTNSASAHAARQAYVPAPHALPHGLDLMSET